MLHSAMNLKMRSWNPKYKKQNYMARGVWELKVLQRRSFHGFRETGRVNGKFFVSHKFGFT
jgi:hypothetical protein